MNRFAIFHYGCYSSLGTFNPPPFPSPLSAGHDTLDNYRNRLPRMNAREDSDDECIGEKGATKG